VMMTVVTMVAVGAPAGSDVDCTQLSDSHKCSGLMAVAWSSK
jgi:hypothetical protein